VTPLQAAKAHCANYQPDGSCLGIYHRDDLSIDWQRCKPLPKCPIGDCQACPYFEEIVLPQVSASVAAKYHKSLPAGVNTGVRPQHAIKQCLDCRRREVRPRQKYCLTCARIRKRASKRRHMRAKRGLDVEKLANSPLRAEALARLDTKTCYSDPGVSVSDSSFSTRQPPAQDVSETRGNLNPEEAIAS
jgi:hypothetical protein